MYKIWVADLDSPSYFVAVAAAELGFFKQQGIDVEFVFNTKQGPELMREGKLDFMGGPAFCSTRAFPGWQGVKLLCALARHSYWFLAVRKDLDVRKGDLQALKGMTISAASSWPGMGLRHMLKDAGFDLERDGIKIIPPPPPYGDKGWMARNGLDVIESGQADAFWGNGMRVALAESLGIAKMHLDLRRGDGPPGARGYNFPALTVREVLVRDRPEVAAGAVRAIIATQNALKADPSLAVEVGRRLYPDDETALIQTLIERDAPYYDPEITAAAVDGLNAFAVSSGLRETPIAYADLVATEMMPLWKTS